MAPSDTDIDELIAKWRSEGHKLRAEGSEVSWIPPPNTPIPEDLMRKFETRKDEFLAFLSIEGAPTADLREASPHKAKVVDRRDLPGSMSLLRLDVSEAARRTYTEPGQYAQVRVHDRSSYFVLASDPDGATWDVIVRPSGYVASKLAAAPEGMDLFVSSALGGGFPLQAVAGHLLGVAVVGVGIAAALPVVRSQVRRGEGPNTRVYIGVRTEEELPFRQEIEEWLASGVGVTVCLSRGEGNDETDMTKLRLVSGYVQDALARDLPAAPPVSIFVVGPNEMVQAIRALAPVLSMDQRDILTNY
jgi:NAD(P)H-flavin reductase